jgi:hypothetical protein
MGSSKRYNCIAPRGIGWGLNFAFSILITMLHVAKRVPEIGTDNLGESGIYGCLFSFPAFYMAIVWAVGGFAVGALALYFLEYKAL